MLLSDFNPVLVMVNSPFLGLALGFLGAVFVGRIGDSRRRKFAVLSVSIFPLAVLLIAAGFEGCLVSIAPGTLGYDGLTKEGACWGKYGFGGLMFLMIGMPCWLLAVAAGAIIGKVHR